MRTTLERYFAYFSYTFIVERLIVVVFFFCHLLFLINNIFSFIFPSREAVAGSLAGKRHRCQGAESPRLDHEENPGLQRGVSETQVILDSAHFPPGVTRSALSAHHLLSFALRRSKVYVFLCCGISHKLSVSVKPSVGLRLPVCLSSMPRPHLPTPPTPPHPRIFSHPNVLPVLGACLSPAPHPVIITHWMPYGSLYNVLHEGTSEYFHDAHENSCLTSFVVLKGFVCRTCTP